VLYWRKQQELLNNSKGDSREFCGTKAGKSAYFTHPDFSAAKLKKKSAQIMLVNAVYIYIYTYIYISNNNKYYERKRLMNFYYNIVQNTITLLNVQS
jgi:hypothetical protein